MSTLTFRIIGNSGDAIKDVIEVVDTQDIDSTFVDALKAQYEAVCDGAITNWTGSQDIQLAAATTAELGTSVEVSWGLKVRKLPKGTFTHDMPIPKAAQIVNGQVNVSATAIVDWAAQFALATKYYISNGQSVPANSIIKGYWKGATARHSNLSKKV